MFGDFETSQIPKTNQHDDLRSTYMYERTNEWTTERMNEWMNEFRMYGCCNRGRRLNTSATPTTAKSRVLAYSESFVLYKLSISILLLPAWALQTRSRPQQLTLCQSSHAEALQATVSEGLDHGPYVAARAGFELTTLPGRKVSTLKTLLMRHHTPQSKEKWWAVG